MRLSALHNILLLLAIAGLLSSCSKRHPNTPRSLGSIDTLYTETRAMALYEQDPERSLAMIESAEISGTLPDFRANLLRAKLFTLSTNNQRQEVAHQLCEELLQHDSVQENPTYQHEVLELLVNASRMRHDDEQWLRWAMQLSALLRSQGAYAEALRTEAEIGLVMTHLGQVSDGLAKIDDALQQLDGQPTFAALQAFVLASKRKIVVLRETGSHDQILPVAERLQERLNDFAEHPDVFTDKPMAEAERNDFIDFYGAQATAFKAAAYAETGRRHEARHELDIFSRTAYSRTLDGRKMIAPTLGLLGDYTQMLTICNEAEAEMQGDTLRHDYAEILLARAVAAEAQGRMATAIDFRKRYEALLQTLNSRLQQSQAHDYAARYHAQEQKMEIDRREADAERNGIIALSLTVVLLGVVGFVFYLFKQKRNITRKNRLLVEQISDAIEYKKRYETLLTQKVSPKGEGWQRSSPGLQASDGAEGSDNADTDDAPTEEEKTDLSALTDEALFQCLSEAIRREQLYLNPVCDRQFITDRFGLSEKRVGAAFSKGSTYKSLPSFIRDCRLEYACQLLRQKPEMSIGAVAAASGFSNHTRFTADFKARYSVSPTEFRSLSM